MIRSHRKVVAFGSSAHELPGEHQLATSGRHVVVQRALPLLVPTATTSCEAFRRSSAIATRKKGRPRWLTGAAQFYGRRGPLERHSALAGSVNSGSEN